MTAKRLWLLDVLRGAALLNMLAYHALYDWVYVFGHASSWYDIGAAGCHVWQQYICWSFILVSGYSFTLARRPWKNGLLVAGCAVVLTVVTVGFMPSESIWFGVLHLNAAAVLLSWALRPLLEKCPAGLGLAVSALLFALTNQVPQGCLGFETLRLCALPKAWYSPNCSGAGCSWPGCGGPGPGWPPGCCVRWPWWDGIRCWFICSTSRFSTVLCGWAMHCAEAASWKSGKNVKKLKIRRYMPAFPVDI